MIHHAGADYTAGQINDLVWNGKESPEKAELYVFYLKNKLRQIHAVVNVRIKNDTYALCEEE